MTGLEKFAVTMFGLFLVVLITAAVWVHVGAWWADKRWRDRG